MIRSKNLFLRLSLEDWYSVPWFLLPPRSPSLCDLCDIWSSWWIAFVFSAAEVSLFFWLVWSVLDSWTGVDCAWTSEVRQYWGQGQTSGWVMSWDTLHYRMGLWEQNLWNLPVQQACGSLTHSSDWCGLCYKTVSLPSWLWLVSRWHLMLISALFQSVTSLSSTVWIHRNFPILQVCVCLHL